MIKPTPMTREYFNWLNSLSEEELESLDLNFSDKEKKQIGKFIIELDNEQKHIKYQKRISFFDFVLYFTKYKYTKNFEIKVEKLFKTLFCHFKYKTIGIDFNYSKKFSPSDYVHLTEYIGFKIGDTVKNHMVREPMEVVKIAKLGNQVQFTVCSKEDRSFERTYEIDDLSKELEE